VEFRTLPASKGFYHFFPHRVVPFDAQSRQTRFVALCPTCGFYESVAGATPSFLSASELLADGFSRSDILFGSRNEKHPLVFVSTGTQKILACERFTGMSFNSASSAESATPPPLPF